MNQPVGDLPNPAPRQAAKHASCPTCQSGKARLLGPSTFNAEAETALVVALEKNSGSVYRCPNCRLVFRAPMPSHEELTLAYETMPVSSWSYVEPPHWQWALDCIRDLAPNKRVLDVGCFRGDFLAKLPGFERFGIEPNVQAGEVAEGLGIKILGRDAMDELPGYEKTFGAIILMDVAEHVPNPAAVFRHLRRFLAPNGVLLVMTGNAENWLTRFSLPFYWYMGIPMHLVYLGDAYFRWVGKTDHWHLARTTYYAFGSQRRKVRLRQMGIGVGVMLWQKCRKLSLLSHLLLAFPAMKRIAAMRTPPLLYTRPDHIGVALVERPGQSSRT